MQEIVLIKNGELVLKGLNRSSFEDVLIKNMRKALKPLGEFTFTKSQSTIMVEPVDKETDLDDAVDKLKKVFGIAALSRAAIAEKSIDSIRETTLEYLEEELEEASTFKVEAKRSDKKFPMKSPEICRELGGDILSKFNHLKVDVHNPDIVVTVEIRDNYAFIRGNNIKGAGGMPVGTGGKAAVSDAYLGQAFPAGERRHHAAPDFCPSDAFAGAGRRAGAGRCTAQGRFADSAALRRNRPV